MTKGGKLMEDIFEGATINTVSMLCIEDAIDAMEWGKSVGGLKAMQARADANFKVLTDWVAKTAVDRHSSPRSRSSAPTPRCASSIADPDDHGARCRCAGGLRQGDRVAARQGRRRL